MPVCFVYCLCNNIIKQKRKKERIHHEDHEGHEVKKEKEFTTEGTEIKKDVSCGQAQDDKFV